MHQFSRLRLVTFDVTETLLTFRVPPAEKYADVGAQFGVIVDPNVISANFKKHWRYMSTSHPNFGQRTGLGWEKWWKLLVNKTFQDTVQGNAYNVSIFDTIGDHLIELYKTCECWKTVEGAEELLNHFNKLRVPLGIISNYDERLETVLEAMDLHHHFQFIITSYCAGFEKPDSRIFRLALCQLGNGSIKPNEALHVGNMPEIDYLGAVKAGWNAALVHQNPKKVTEHYHGVDPELVFETLKDFESYITHLHK
ncbi:Rhythmically expressed gene 2 protein [Cryptotermes secundus]|uniref:Rhythmically expressed gene 2 protein n=1 Tax=Cryptotermes secundus TaxID=105785 RepID=A0A2J7QU82_9NEOP|nr:rhythmically expressed gene 2 protein [Cryptotermes secundus]PNF32148.1 Rhythmically expressed gene 2 protein [Cryptotermes secundus]